MRIKEYNFFDTVQPLVLGGSVNQVWSFSVAFLQIWKDHCTEIKNCLS